jgi:lipopolysaccharide transport system ATP-binding protein
MSEEYMIDVDHVTIRFNLSSEKVDNLKEYVIRLLKRQLLFQEFLAVKDVSLKIKKGEAWGLIGVNGSGKSTLLKAISGIMKPYQGTIQVNGSVSPLIELQAGFDSNMTARENIFLNGAVLGHSKKFMQEHFDEIVDFAGIRQFLDSPIKNYSSGMKARLGFAVATVVKPDILIVDEVLAVGDVRFRKKCMKRMQELLSGGTTLLFVSHNIEQVKSLCTHALWLDHGTAVMAGPAAEVCDKYTEAMTESEEGIKKTPGKGLAEGE